MMGDAATRAGLMDRIYRRQRHVYDLTRRHYLLGRNDLIAALDPPTGGSVLEIGCGTARNLVMTARAYPRASLYGIDISAEMLKSARTAIHARGLSHRVTLAQADATCFDAQSLFGQPIFDRVFMSYTVSMIPGWETALAQALAVVAPGGQLHVVDFGRQSRLPDWFAAALRVWLARFHVTPRDRLGEVLAGLASSRNTRLEFRHAYRDYACIGTIRLP